MNTANLQLEGLLMALATLIDALKQQGAIKSGHVDEALMTAIEKAKTELSERSELSPSNQNAALFPMTFLLAANAMDRAGMSFRTIVSAMKER